MKINRVIRSSNGIPWKTPKLYPCNHSIFSTLPIIFVIAAHLGFQTQRLKWNSITETSLSVCMSSCLSIRLLLAASHEQ